MQNENETGDGSGDGLSPVVETDLPIEVSQDAAELEAALSRVEDLEVRAYFQELLRALRYRP